MVKMGLFGSQILLTVDFEGRSRLVNNCVNICLDVPESQIKPYKFLIGLNRDYCSSFTSKEIVNKWQESQPFVPRAGLQPWVGLEAEQ